ncbi:MAG: hypothetical protein GY749_40240 [Desulfobacteraceae bacterium]|nr:hypothetical protein [Desulfobacteraceae bacterium]
MNLKELLKLEREFKACPVRSEDTNLMAVLEDRIASERAKALAADNDPLLNARIEKYKQEGRICAGGFPEEG